jgi:hypothetical protein
MSAGSRVLQDLGLTSGDLGSAPQTKPNAVTSVSQNLQSLGLSGMSNFPTLQGKEALSNPASPVSATATSLAPNSSFTTQGTPQVM